MIEAELGPEKPVDQVEAEYAKLVTYELSAKSWEELEAIEFNDRLLFPDVLHVRRKSGKFEQVKVAFRIPRGPELREAKVEAKALFAEQGLDWEKDKDEFNDFHDTCILWRALRSPSEPYEPKAVDIADLEKQFDRDVLKLAWSKLEGYRRSVDPRPAAITREQVLLVVAAVAKRRAISPLLVFDGPAQDSCIVFMASLLQRLLTSQPSKPSSESSTPVPSA